MCKLFFPSHWLLTVAVAGGSEPGERNVPYPIYGSEVPSWELLQYIAPNSIRYVDTVVDSVVNVSDAIASVAMNTLSSLVGGLHGNHSKSTTSQSLSRHSAFLELSRAQGLAGGTSLQVMKVVDATDESTNATAVDPANQMNAADKSTGVEVLTKVKGVKLHSQVTSKKTTVTEDIIVYSAATVFYLLCILVRRQFVKKRRRTEDAIQDKRHVRKSLAYDSEEDEDEAVMRSTSTWVRTWEDNFFWLRVFGIRKDGQVGPMLILEVALLLVYASLKSYLILTLDERLPVPCNTWILHAAVVHPTDPQEFKYHWIVLSQGIAAIVMFRILMYIMIILISPKVIVITLDQTLAYELRVAKHPETKHKMVEYARKLFFYWCELWTWNCMCLLCSWNRVSLWHEILGSGDSIWLANYVLNMFGECICTWANGLFAGGGVFIAVMMTDWVDVQASRIQAISPEETIDIQNKVREVAKNVHELHWSYFKNKMHAFEVLVALFGIYYLLNLSSSFIAAIPLAAMRDTPEEREAPEWEAMKYTAKRNIAFCSIGACLSIGLPVFVNKHCDRLAMRINDLLMNITCSVEINDDSPESHSSSKKERGEMAKATIALSQLQSFLDHCNLKSGMGVCIMGIRITPKLARMIGSAAIFICLKCENYISALLDCCEPLCQI